MKNIKNRNKWEKDKTKPMKWNQEYGLKPIP